MYNGIFREQKGFANIKRKPRKQRTKIINTPKIPMINTKINTINKKNNNPITVIKKPKEKKERIKKNEKLHNFQLPYLNYEFNFNNEENISNITNINFLHIQKTGGRSLTRYIKMKRLSINSYHYIVNVNKPLKNLFFIIRDPITRYISGFNHMYFIVKELIFHWSDIYGEKQKYNYFYKYFSTPNNLAESLTSTDLIRRKLAYEAFSYINCINNGYDKWFENIKLKDIQFILRFEELQKDINEIFCKKINISPFKLLNYDTIGKKKWNEKNSQMKYLSIVAIENLKKIYIKDYYFIDQLISIGLLDKLYKNKLI